MGLFNKKPKVELKQPEPFPEEEENIEEENEEIEVEEETKDENYSGYDFPTKLHNLVKIYYEKEDQDRKHMVFELEYMKQQLIESMVEETQDAQTE